MLIVMTWYFCLLCCLLLISGVYLYFIARQYPKLEQSIITTLLRKEDIAWPHLYTSLRNHGFRLSLSRLQKIMATLETDKLIITHQQRILTERNRFAAITHYSLTTDPEYHHPLFTRQPLRHALSSILPYTHSY